MLARNIRKETSERLSMCSELEFRTMQLQLDNKGTEGAGETEFSHVGDNLINHT